MRNLYSIALLSLSFLTFGQSKVLFQSGTYHLNPAQGTELRQLSKSEQDAQRVLRVISLSDMITDAQLQTLFIAGIEMHGYLPFKSYILSMPVTPQAWLAIEALKISGFSPLLPDMKLSEQLASGNVPAYTWIGDRWEILAEVHDVESLHTAIQSAEALGAQVLSYTGRSFKASIRPDDLRLLASIPSIVWVQQREAPAEKENYTGTKNHRSNALRVPYAGGREYDGSGITVGHGDDGDIVPHIDFTGRILFNRSGASNGDHGDHVAGTILGAGNLDPNGQGQAPGADLVYSSYPANLNNVDGDYLTYGVRVTASSYSNGCNAGYTSFTRTMDQDIRDNYSLMHVFSAGNAGSSNCSYGAGSGWGNITGGHKQGKNVIATANLMSNDVLAGSSSRGPAHDGRIKPDISAMGTSVYSTISPNSYGVKTGTSMACPGVAGVMAQLWDAYKQNHNGSEPAGGLMKAILTNTADDLGNPGPDYKHGYGRMNALRAVKAIENNWFVPDTIANGQVDTVSILVPAGLGELRVMLHWTDPEATVNAQRALVNDLNGLLVQDASSWLPWVLDPTPNSAALNGNATRAVDSLNNSEQFTVLNPSGGQYKLIVDASVAIGTQTYWVTYSFIEQAVELTYPIGGEVLKPSTNYPIRWDASPGSASFAIQLSSNGGTSWTTVASPTANQRQAIFTVPSGAGDDMVMQITRGSQSDTSNARMGRVAVPSNIQVAWACPDSLRLTWNAVSGASGYVVYQLGSKYMDPIDTVNGNYTVLHNVNNGITQWYSVAAITPGGMVGERAYAIEKNPGLMGCVLQTDAQLIQLTSPIGGIPDCQNTSSLDLAISLKNGGSDTLFNLPIALQIGSGAITRDTLSSYLIPTQVISYVWSNVISASALGNYTYRVWTEMPGDQYLGNDSLEGSFSVLQSDSTYALPYLQNFNGFFNCGTSTNCGNTTCSLAGHWTNALNGSFDDHDWRTHSGGTASSGTGPSGGQSGASGDKYLYLEASGGCNYAEALGMTPCIDLTSATLPEIKFWYHMNGSNMGELHVDIMSQGQWVNDIITPVTGSQGSLWIEKAISLTSYVGQVVQIRFRGITGSSWSSDMAIDEVSITEVSSSPTAILSISNMAPCVNEVVDLSDLSVNSPNQWLWTLLPASGFSYLNGTDSTSQHPQVAFTSYGNYSVRLIASNGNGSDTAFGAGNIVINGGAALPFAEPFNTFLPNGWQIDNLDNGTTWSDKIAIGSSGVSTKTAYMDNFTYNNPLSEDRLVTPGVDLTGASQAILVFDVAYAAYSANYLDGLRVDVSTNCGSTWTATSYLKQGSALSTVSFQSAAFTPNSAGAWRTDTVLLPSAVSGPSVKFRFAAINGYGNNLYIDNVQVYNLGAAAPVASIGSTAGSSSCIGDSLQFTALNSGNALATWNFGPGSTPGTASGIGPHTVTYFSGGSKDVILTLNSAGGQDDDTMSFTLGYPTIAAFTRTINQQTATFTDISTASPSQWHWDFGDGNTASTQNPVHTYAAGGNYVVTLGSYNSCGWDSTDVTFYISGVGIDESGSAGDWFIQPNPSNGQITVHMPQNAVVQSYEVIDMLGRTLIESNLPEDGQLNLGALPSGRYMLRIHSKDQVKVLPLIRY